MTLEFASQRPPIQFIKAPALLVMLAVLTIWLEDIFKMSLPYLVRTEVKMVVQYDRARMDLSQLSPYLPVAVVFAVTYCLFLVRVWS